MRIKIKKFSLPIAIIISLLTSLGCRNSTEVGKYSGDILWYAQPSESWEEALPVGNGRIGAMIFGGTTTEHLQLNDDSLWPADKGWDEPAGTPEDLQKIRDLLFEGNNAKADAMFVDKFSRKKVVRSHQTLGDLYIDFNHENVSEYRRELDIEHALARVSYQTQGKHFSEEVYASKPHNAIVVKLTSDAPDGFGAKIRLKRPEDQGNATAVTRSEGNDILIMSGEVTQYGAFFDSKPDPILEGVQFETRIKVYNTGGEIQNGPNFLEMKNVSEAVIYIVSNSSYYHHDFQAKNMADLEALEQESYAKIKNEHIEDFQGLYNRVEFSLDHEGLDSIPTDKRLERVKNGEIDLGLESMLFNYGRYLLISSSRQETNPANLQGLWNQHIEAPWNADYHLNINLQMNYWLADVTQLGELNYPLFDYIDRLVENGKQTARQNFGCQGTFIPHATDLWAPTWLRAPTAYWGCSIGAGGWLMQHYWEHFQFTGDTTFLKERAFPAIQEVAQFYSDWIIEDPRDGSLISSPSTSPENRFINSKGESVATCLGSAMDQQVITEVFDNYIKACTVLSEENALLDTIMIQRQKLRPGFVLGSDGRILEWDREYEEPEPGHRHMSHLYGFHPGTSVTQQNNPELFEAVKTTLDYRLVNGGAGTGWSRAWLINCAARLHDGNMAHDHIQLLFQKSMLINLFDAHPPFQIDGNFGYTAGVAEMLLQSHESNTIRLLPALPDVWQNGSITGLRARGGFTVDLIWKKNKLENAVITADYNSTVNLTYEDELYLVEMSSGETYTYNPTNE